MMGRDGGGLQPCGGESGTFVSNRTEESVGNHQYSRILGFSFVTETTISSSEREKVEYLTFLSQT